MTQHIIAICGHRRSGKSTLARYICGMRRGHIRKSFADPFKKMLIDLVISQGCRYNIVTKMFYGDLKDTPSEYLAGRTPVYAMQTLATDWGKNLMYIDFWTNILINQIQNSSYNIVVDDLRFLAEERAIRAFPSVVVRVDRPLCDLDPHVSETEFLQITPDIVLNNNSTPEDLFASFEQNMQDLETIARDAEKQVWNKILTNNKGDCDNTP